MEHPVNAYRLEAPVIAAGRFLAVIDRDARAASKPRVKLVMAFPYRAIETRRLRAEQHRGRQVNQGSEMRWAAVVRNHEPGDRIEREKLAEFRPAGEIYATTVVEPL